MTPAPSKYPVSTYYGLGTAPGAEETAEGQTENQEHSLAFPECHVPAGMAPQLRASAEDPSQLHWPNPGLVGHLLCDIGQFP